MSCVLKLNALLFDEIHFNRLGLKNSNELEIEMEVNIGTNMTDKDTKKVTVKVLGNKKEEYTFEVQASGFFNFEGEAEDSIMHQNAVAIVMPYIRSEISLLTAQPGVESVVLPPLNIVEMLEAKKI